MNIYNDHDENNELLYSTEAATTIQQAFRRTKKLRAVHSKLTAMADMLCYIVHVLNVLDTASFEASQRELLRNERFYLALSGLLSSLPRDPNLKSNYQNAKNFRVITTALIIAKHSREVLIQEEGGSFTKEATACRNASEVVMKCIRRLCESVVKSTGIITETESKVGGHRTIRYRNAFLCYRYAIRSYLSAFELWKAQDVKRLIKNAEDGFVQCYSIYLSAKASALLPSEMTGGEASSDIDTKMALFVNAEEQMQKIRAAFLQLVVGNSGGPGVGAGTSAKDAGTKVDRIAASRAKGEARLEELSASVESSSAAFQALKRFEEVREQQKQQKHSSLSSSSSSSSSFTAAATVAAATMTSEELQKRAGDGTGTTSVSGVASDTISIPSGSISSSPLSASSSSSSSSSASLLSGGAQVLLENLSRLAGKDSEKLAYEIMLDKYMRLPSPSSTTVTAAGDSSGSSSSSSSTPAWKQHAKYVPPLTDFGSSSVASSTDDRSGIIEPLPPTAAFSPAAAAAAASDSSSTPAASIGEVMKLQLLRSLGDKLLNSLRVSNVESYGQLRKGAYVPVYYLSNQDMQEVIANSSRSSATTAASSSLVSSAGDSEGRAAVVLRSEDIAGIPVHTAHILEMRPTLQKQNHRDQREHEEPLESVVDESWEMDIFYAADMTRENNVSVRRVKLSTHGSDPLPLLTAIDGLCQQIAALIPNRKDMITNLVKSIDFPLVQQMIVNNAITNPETDFLPILRQFQDILQSLQAPSRVADSNRWIDTVKRQLTFKKQQQQQQRSTAGQDHKANKGVAANRTSLLSIRVPDNDDDDDNDSTTKDGSRSEDSSVKAEWQDVVALLPAFFERANEVIEEIQRDMANYYISLLGPMLQEHGATFLASRFMQRVQNGEQSLSSTARWLAHQLGGNLSVTGAAAAAATNTALTSLATDMAEALGGMSEEYSLRNISAAAKQQAGVVVVAAAAAGAAAGAAGAAAGASPLPVLAKAVLARAFLSLLLLPVRLDATPQQQQQWPTGIDFPETLEFDRSRMAAMRDKIDIISIECSLVISTRQLLARYKLQPRDTDEIELQHRLDVLLTEKDVNFSTVTTEVYKYILNAVHRARYGGNEVDMTVVAEGDRRHSESSERANKASKAKTAVQDVYHDDDNKDDDQQSPPPESPHTPKAALETAKAAMFSAKTDTAVTTTVAEAPTSSRTAGAGTGAGAVTSTSREGNETLKWFDADDMRKLVEKSVRDVLSSGNPVLTLFSKRLIKVLLRALCGQPYLHKLPAFSLQSKGQERNISQLVLSAQQLFEHTYKIFGPLYCSIVHAEAERMLQG